MNNTAGRDPELQAYVDEILEMPVAEQDVLAAARENIDLAVFGYRSDVVRGMEQVDDPAAFIDTTVASNETGVRTLLQFLHSPPNLGAMQLAVSLLPRPSMSGDDDAIDSGDKEFDVHARQAFEAAHEIVDELGNTFLARYVSSLRQDRRSRLAQLLGLPENADDQKFVEYLIDHTNDNREP